VRQVFVAGVDEGDVRKISHLGVLKTFGARGREKPLKYVRPEISVIQL
jgi:hypothetical protein